MLMQALNLHETNHAITDFEAGQSAIDFLSFYTCHAGIDRSAPGVQAGCHIAWALSLH